jgi:hypothetical protein
MKFTPHLSSISRLPSRNPFLTFLFATPPRPIRMNARSQNIEDHWQYPMQITHIELEAKAHVEHKTNTANIQPTNSQYTENIKPTNG